MPERPLPGTERPRRSQKTTDHETIRGWAEARAGVPMHVTAGCPRDDPAVLRIRFLGQRQEPAPVEPIQWREWFQRFDELGLALEFRDETPAGRPSTFNKLVPRAADAPQPPAT